LLSPGQARGAAGCSRPLSGGLSLSFLIIAHSGEHVIEMQNMFTGMDVTMTPQQMLILRRSFYSPPPSAPILWRRAVLLARARRRRGRGATNRWETFFSAFSR
jgi:hypothetical protein